MRHLILVGTLVLAYALPAPAQTRPVTVDDVMAMKAVSAPAVSPDGTQVLYAVRAWEPASAKDADRLEARTRIWKVPAAGGPARQLTFGERGDTQPQWSPDGRYISFVSARGAGEGDASPKAQLYVMRADGGEAWKLTDAKENVGAYSWSPDAKRVAYVTQDAKTSDEDARLKKRDDARVYEGDFRYAHLWTIGVDSHEAVKRTEGRDLTVSGAPSWSPDATKLAFAAAPTSMVRDDRSDIYVLDLAGKQTEKITTNAGPDASPRWSPDGRTIAYVSEPNTNRALGDGIGLQTVTQQHLMLYDVATKRSKDAASRDFDTAAGTPTWSADSARVYFAAGRRVYTEVFAYDLASAKYTKLTTGRNISLGNQSRDGSVVALIAESVTEPADVHVADASFTSIRKLTTVNPQVANFALGETEVVTWKSSDGKEVEGVLLKPVGVASGQRVPLLVVAHGGPTGAHTNTFRVGGLEGGQALAGQGWAVFYPNVRGSTNYGEAFMRANIPDWGGGDWRDLMTGVDALIAKGVADPNRLALIGWSYGGYMTAWGITQTTRFKAAMVGAGITNVWSMYGTNDIPNYLGTFFGGIPDATTRALYMERSAMTHVDKVTTPTLILHGGNDERVPTGQALELHRALKERGKITELVFYPREGHGIQEYYHQKDRLTRIHAWLSRYVLADGRKTTTQ
jgi:dipeptidyl aminopeptidase/acylaminoacyl peptidase